LDSFSVDKDPVAAAHIGDLTAILVTFDPGVVARSEVIINGNVAGWMPPNGIERAV
jgi:hypothetical protein